MELMERKGSNEMGGSIRIQIDPLMSHQGLPGLGGFVFVT